MMFAVLRSRHQGTKARGMFCPKPSSCLRAFVAAPLLSIVVVAAQPPNVPPTQDLQHPQNTNIGIFTFTGRCATCHDTGKDGATDRYALNRFTPEQVLASITTGSMAQYAQGLSDFERRVVAVYVGGRPLGSYDAGEAAKMRNRCAAPLPFEPASGQLRPTRPHQLDRVEPELQARSRLVEDRARRRVYVVAAVLARVGRATGDAMKPGTLAT